MLDVEAEAATLQPIDGGLAIGVHGQMRSSVPLTNKIGPF